MAPRTASCSISTRRLDRSPQRAKYKEAHGESPWASVDCLTFKSSSAEARTASAGAGGVGIVENKAASHQLILEIDGGVVQVEIALGIADHPNRELLALRD